MYRKSVFLVLLLVIAGPFSREIAAQDKFVVDKVVANVGTSVILYSEMDELAKELQQQRRERGYTSDREPMGEALEELLLQKLLYQQAQIDSLDIDKAYIQEMVEEAVGHMVAERGSVAAVEGFYHKPIFDVKRQLQQRYEEMYYAREMRRDVESKVSITPGEVERYYYSLHKDSLPIIPEQYIYSQIMKLPTSTKEAKQRVRERLLEMRERVINGTQFELLARMYSQDPGSAMRGGEMDFAPKETYVTPFANALEKLRPGQISEVVETEYGFHIIQLVDKQGNLYKLRHILLRPQYTTQEMMESDRFLDSLAGQIRSGAVTFEKAAYEHSDDKYSKLNGGIVSNHDILEMYQAFDATLTTTKFLREDLQPDVYRVISNLKPGEISSSFQSIDLKGNDHSKIIKLLEVIPSHPASLKEDYLRVEEMALEAKQEKEFQKWLDRKIESMYIYIEPEYRNSEFENKAWIK